MDNGIHWRLFFHHLRETHEHGFLPEGWGYAVGLTWINRNEADSYQLEPKPGILSREIN
jgi:hypothetical protein